MTDSKKTEPFDIKPFARIHGLERLSPQHLARMAELAPRIAQLGRTIPRPPDKLDAPAQRCKLLKSTS